MEDLVCVTAIFEAIAHKYSDNKALTLGEESYTYTRLNTKANQLAHYLLQRKLGSYPVIGICMDRSFELIVSILGIIKSGATYLPIDAQYLDTKSKDILLEAKPELIITQGQFLDKIGDYSPNSSLICFEEIEDSLKIQAQSNLDIEVLPQSLLYIIYTSGSTGKPKGVMVEHRNVSRIFQNMPTIMQFNSKDKWAFLHSYAFGFSIWEIFGALLTGGELIIIPRGSLHEPANLYQILVEKKVSVLSQTPSGFRQALLSNHFLKQSTNQLSLKYIILSGESIIVQDVQRWFEVYGDNQPLIINTYAITETGGQVTYKHLTQENTSTAGEIGLGKCFDGMQMHIVSEEQQKCPVDEIGELYISGSGLARGYYNDNILSTLKFDFLPIEGKENIRVYKTGDLAKYLANGEVVFNGRKDSQVKIRGFRIELKEIEVALQTHFQIQGAFVCVDEQNNHKRLLAYLVLKDPYKETNISELREYLSTHLSNQMIPNSFIFLKAFPLNQNNKIDRPALPIPSKQRPFLSNDYAKPQTNVEQEILEIWQKVLQINDIGLYDSFFELGGDSIQLVIVLNKIEQIFGLVIPMTSFFNEPSIFGLATKIEQVKLNNTLEQLGDLSEEEIHLLLSDVEDETTEN